MKSFFVASSKNDSIGSQLKNLQGLLKSHIKLVKLFDQHVTMSTLLVNEMAGGMFKNHRFLSYHL